MSGADVSKSANVRQCSDFGTLNGLSPIQNHELGDRVADLAAKIMMGTATLAQKRRSGRIADRLIVAVGC